MGLRINTNVEAFNGHRNLSATSGRLAKSMERLSSGFRINSAADDAAGLGISERMRGQISGLEQAQRNCQDGISLVQTAEGAMQEMTSILHRIRDLAVQYNNGSTGPDGQFAITTEVAQLSLEIDRMATTTQFNGIQLINNAGGTIDLQVGANAGEILTVTTVDVAIDIGTAVSAFAGTPFTGDIALLDTAIQNIATSRGSFGAVQNRLEYTVNALGIYQENLMSAESRIRDVDMAQEMTNFTKLQILQQSGTAMLAQANQNSQSILSLLQG